MSSKKSNTEKAKHAAYPTQPPATPSQDPLGAMGAGPINPHLLNELQSEVSSEATPLLQFMLKHAVLIMAGLALFVLLLAAVGGYNWYTEQKLHEAQATLSNIVLSKQGEERILALENFYKTAPSSMHGGILLSLAETSMALKAYDKAAMHFGALASLEGAVGLLAALNQGQALLLAKNAAEALKVLESIVDNAPAQQRIVIQQALAEAAIQAGNIEKARQTFEAMATSSQGPEARFFRYRARTVGQDKKEDEGAMGDPNQSK